MRTDILATVACTLVLLPTLACSSPAKSKVQDNGDVRQGRLVFLALSCGTCHGHDRRGTNIGPPVLNLRKQWTEDQLVQFLQDPSTFKQTDTRLKRISERYGTDMPAAIARDEARLRSLVRYLLSE